MLTLQENVRSLCISSVFRILKIPTPHFLPHSSHIWRRCPLLQYCYQTDAIFATKQCRAALISALQAHSTKSWQVLEFTMHLTTAMWSQSNDRVRNLLRLPPLCLKPPMLQSSYNRQLEAKIFTLYCLLQCLCGKKVGNPQAKPSKKLAWHLVIFLIEGQRFARSFFCTWISVEFAFIPIDLFQGSLSSLARKDWVSKSCLAFLCCSP